MLTTTVWLCPACGIRFPARDSIKYLVCGCQDDRGGVMMTVVARNGVYDCGAFKVTVVESWE